jgi:hypothetical protein
MGFDPSARFKPMFDITKGDISSSVAIQIARSTRGSASEIATQIISKLPFIPNAYWKSEQGYIILSKAPLRLLCDEAESLRQHAAATARIGVPVAVACLIPDLTVPLYARLRLIACAAFQAVCAVCLGRPCTVRFLPGNEEVSVTTLAQLAAVVESVVRSTVKGESDPSLHELAPEGLRGTVWTAHHFYDRFPQKSKKFFSVERAAGRVALKMPPDGWLLARERGLSDLLSAAALSGVVEKLVGTESWLRWVFHGASSIPSGDFDPSVVFYEECASIRWSLLTLRERYERITVRLVTPGAAELAQLDLPEEDLQAHRTLLLRSIFLPAWLEFAVEEGGVLETLSVLEEFSREGHGFLNSPRTRQNLSQTDEHEDIVQIVAGLGFALSSILPAVGEAH